MLRQMICAAAAIAATVTAVSAVAETPQKVSFDAKTAKYCIADPAVTGSRIAPTECRSAADWAKLGVTFSTRAQQLASK